MCNGVLTVVYLEDNVKLTRSAQGPRSLKLSIALLIAAVSLTFSVNILFGIGLYGGQLEVQKFSACNKI